MASPAHALEIPDDPDWREAYEFLMVVVSSFRAISLGRALSPPPSKRLKRLFVNRSAETGASQTSCCENGRAKLIVNKSLAQIASSDMRLKQSKLAQVAEDWADR
jgi:hypothetical protein